MITDDKAARRTTALAMLATLHERHPLAFARHRPALAVGIREAIAAANPDLDPNAIGAALAFHCSTESYLRSSAYGPHRVGLDGEIAEPITEGTRIHARRRLAALLKRREKPAPAAAQTKPAPAPKPAATGANASKPRLSLKVGVR